MKIFWVVAALATAALSVPAPAATAAAPGGPSRNWGYAPENLEARIGEINAWLAALKAKQHVPGYVSETWVQAGSHAARPAWIDKGSWKPDPRADKDPMMLGISRIGKWSWREAVAGKKFVLGVGYDSGIRNRYMAMTASEDRGRAELGQAVSQPEVAVKQLPAGGTSTARFIKSTLTDTVAIDWYFDSKSTAFYSLLIMPEEVPHEAPKPEPVAAAPAKSSHAPKSSRRAAASRTPRTTKPLLDVDVEAVMGSCSSEIGLFCNQFQDQPRSALRCLSEHKDALMPSCVKSIESANTGH